MTHELKILPKWYADVESGKKNFEIRVNDRDYKVGDTLVLQEYDKDNYTGREITRKIQYIYQGNGAYGLSEEYCILGLDQEPCDKYIKEIDHLRKYISKLETQIVEQQPCDDAISRQAVNKLVDELARAISDERCCISRGRATSSIMQDILDLPPVNLQIGYCKDCKYFEYDSVAKVDGIPLIVAHEICKRWGKGCKTKEEGYCFLYEPQERNK